MSLKDHRKKARNNSKLRYLPAIVAAYLMFLTGCKTSVQIEKLESPNRVKKSPDKIEQPEIQKEEAQKNRYFLHKHIKTTYFYIGEKDSSKSGVIDNGSSAWTSDWVKAYGGIDYPDRRNGYFPAGFIPKENPFYCALPYNDITRNGHKKNIEKIIPWKKEIDRQSNGEFVSYCKNRWIKIIYKGKVCYAQWEDVGPFETDDAGYVFGKSRPKNRRNGGVGLDISPACFKYLGMKDNDYTDWQFVDFKDVPDGPWLKVITISNPRW